MDSLSFTKISTIAEREKEKNKRVKCKPLLEREKYKLLSTAQFHAVYEPIGSVIGGRTSDTACAHILPSTRIVVCYLELKAH
jgi:hypothetical protein